MMEAFDLGKIFNGDVTFREANLKRDQLVRYKDKLFQYQGVSRRAAPIYRIGVGPDGISVEEWDDTHIRASMCLHEQNEMRYYIAHQYFSGRWTEPKCVEPEKESLAVSEGK